MKLDVPKHIAIIMDGNGRWAKKKGMPRTYGHKIGVEALKKTMETCSELGIKYITVYAFSTENWKRNKSEVDMLMFIFKSYLKNEEASLIKNKVRFMVSGRKDGIPEDLSTAIEKLEAITKDNDRLIFNIAFNYGGRSEIVDAIKKIVENGEKEISEETVEKYLYNNLPDPDLLIRTSGEMRISNFLLWQIAYSEIYITDVCWPDFNRECLLEAIEHYQKRERRFGGIE